MTDDPRFFAWLDGELTAEEAAEMEREVARDPALQAVADKHRALKQRLGTAFGAVAAAPLPDRLLEGARPKAKVVDLAAARERRRWAWGAQAAAMAASLAVGLFAGATLLGPESMVRSDGGRVVASGTLDHALSTQLAGAGQVDGIRMGLSFRARDGAYCRSYASGTNAGLACREEGDWRIRGLLAGGEDQISDYRLAAGQDPRLMELVEAEMSGEPLDAEAEAKQVRRGWRN